MSNFLRHEPCPKCHSKDNLARYTDGHGYCFGCQYYEHPSGETPDSAEPTKEERVTDLIDYEITGLPKRGLDEETCKKWRYGVGTYSGRAVQVANYCDSHGHVVAQKLRFQDSGVVIHKLDSFTFQF